MSRFPEGGSQSDSGILEKTKQNPNFVLNLP